MNRRAEIFKEFLTSNNFYIDYNGVVYTLIDKENNMITQTNTPDEMFAYILGFNKAKEILNIG